VNADGSIEGLPARHWMRAHHRMDWGERVPDVEWRPTRGHDFVATGCCGGFEHGLGAGCREGLEVSPHRGRYAIVTIHVRKRFHYVPVVL
jgi:hypothetical protein